MERGNDLEGTSPKHIEVTHRLSLVGEIMIAEFFHSLN